MSKYQTNFEAAIEGDKNHPFHESFGFHMQIHHILSQKGIAGAKFAIKIKNMGYNMNRAGNLVALPSTLQGACHLGVQPHRGNHEFVEKAHKGDDIFKALRRDKKWDYHRIVAETINGLEIAIENICSQSSKKMEKEVQKLLDRASRQILEEISEFELPIHSMYKSFHPQQGSGCANIQNTPKQSAELARCTHQRNHNGLSHQYNATSKTKTIAFTGHYPLKQYRSQL